MEPYRARPLRPWSPGTPKCLGSGGGGGGNDAPSGLSGVERVGVRDPSPDLGLARLMWSGEECAGNGEPNVSVGGDGVALLLPTEPASMTGRRAGRTSYDGRSSSTQVPFFPPRRELAGGRWISLLVWSVAVGVGRSRTFTDR